MADPKYADLPGIAHDEPDTYETSDLPESDQTSNFYEQDDTQDPDSFEKIHLNVSDAYNKFKDKHLNAGKVDFSNRISNQRRTGYDAFELIGYGEKENVIQKYQRLKCELEELLDEVNKIKETKPDEENVGVSSVKVENSLKKLLDLKLEDTLGEGVLGKISDPQGTQIQKLLSQLEQFKTSLKEKPEAQAGTEGDLVTYQFSYRPEQARLVQTSRVAELESRLNRLENVLGSSKDNLSRLTAATSKGSLLETAQHLSATASLLDSSQLDHIEGRLSALAQKLDAIGEKKKALQQDEEKDKMILELYELVKSSESAGKLIPQTIERLKALEALHNKATDFVSTLSQIELAQSEIAANVQNNKELLQGVQESFAVNFNVINETVESLNTRIKALKKK